MAVPVTPTVLIAAALAGLALAGPAQAGGCYGGGCYRSAVLPPVYATEQEPVLVSPPRTVYRTVPPVYETVAEEVMVSPGGRVWQTRPGPRGELIGCWVVTPPRYALRRRTVVVRPAEVVPVTLPPRYAMATRRVRVAPARPGWVPVDSIPDALGVTGASSSDLGVGLGLARGSIYDGY